MLDHTTPLASLSEGKFLLITPDGRAFRSADPAAIVRVVRGQEPRAGGVAPAPVKRPAVKRSPWAFLARA